MEHNIYALLFAGAGTAVLGAIVGAWIGAALNYRYQKKLLRQQLEFQQEQARLDAEQRKNLSEEQMKVLSYLRDTLNSRLGKLASEMANANHQKK